MRLARSPSSEQKTPMSNDNDRESPSAAAPSRQTEAKTPKTYLIGDLAREFGVTLRTLRFYEDRGLLSPRREGTARIYDARDRSRLSVILKGKQLGFTLTEIRAMVAEERAGEAPAANLKLSLAQVEDQIAHLEQQKVEIEQALAELKAHRDTLVAA